MHLPLESLADNSCFHCTKILFHAMENKGKHPILGYHLSGERWRALAKKLCHKINDFYW